MSKERNTEPWELNLIKYFSATLAQKYPETWEENQHWLRDIIENRQKLLAEKYDYWKVVLRTFCSLLSFGSFVVCEITKSESRKISRSYLLKVLVEFERNIESPWVKRITYWTRSKLESKGVVRTLKEEIIDVDSLPDDVVKEWLKLSNTTQDIDDDDELENKWVLKGLLT